MRQTLIAYKYDTDKSQLYLNNYERYFQAIADQNVKLFELGIDKGGSLLMWRDYFQNGRIVGLDLEYVDIDDPERKIKIYQGDQRDVNLLNRIGGECAPEGFDIIIDDASHIAEFSKISFWHLFDNHLKSGGIYVIEDWRTGYWDGWRDGKQYGTTIPKRTFSLPFFSNTKRQDNTVFHSHFNGMVGLVKQLIDELGMDAITNPARNGLAPQRYPKFQRMEICPGQVFIVKATEKDNDLIAEQLRGVPKATKGDTKGFKQRLR